jgi:hypothetical protein
MGDVLTLSLTAFFVSIKLEAVAEGSVTLVTRFFVQLLQTLVHHLLYSRKNLHGLLG